MQNSSNKEWGSHPRAPCLEKLSVGEVQMWESVLRRQPRKKRESRDERDTLRKRAGPQEGSFSLPLCLEDKRHRILQSDLMKYKK